MTLQYVLYVHLLQDVDVFVLDGELPHLDATTICRREQMETTPILIRPRHIIDRVQLIEVSQWHPVVSLIILTLILLAEDREGVLRGSLHRALHATLLLLDGDSTIMTLSLTHTLV